MTTQRRNMAKAIVKVHTRRELTPNDEELYAQAMEYWMGPGGLNTAKTAREFGINQETLKNWVKKNKWMETYVESHGVLTGPAIEAVSSFVAGHYMEVLPSLIEVAKDTTHPQMVAAQRLLRDWMTAPEKNPITNAQLIQVDARTVNMVENMTPDQIDAMIRQEMQRNLDNAAQQRSRKVSVRERK